MSRSSVLVGLVRSRSDGDGIVSVDRLWASIGLRSEICCHVVRALADVPISGCETAAWRGRELRSCAFQFCCGGAEFYGGEFVFVA